MNNAIGYIRVSTDKDKQANSLAVQPGGIRAYAAMYDLNVVDIISDETSALKVPFFERPGGKQILESIRKGAVQHVIGAKVDRMFRNAQDGLETADWFRAKGIGLHIIDTGGALNVGDAAGRMMFTMLLAVAEFEPRRISQRTREALGELKKNGKRVGTVPYGWREYGGVMIQVPDEMAIVQEIRERAEAGEGLKGIAYSLNLRGIPSKHIGRKTKSGTASGKWHPSAVRNIVQRGTP